MEPSDLLRIVAAILQRFDVPYLVTGSIASSHFGEPRFTNDIDIVADLPLNSVKLFCAAFPESEFYVSEDAVRDAIIHRDQFNILHPSSGLKVDIMIPPRDAFNASRFARARVEQPTGAAGFEATYASPEDVIIKKMDYYRQGESDKHLRDIASMLKIQGDAIDRAYIERWATEMELMPVWEAVLSRVEGRA